MVLRRRSALLLLLSIFVFQNVSAQSEFTLEDAFDKFIFNPKSIKGIKWMNDGTYYTTLEKSSGGDSEQIVKYNIVTGDRVGIILDSRTLIPEGSDSNINIESYSFNKDESKILVSDEIESIYRRSTRAYFYIYDIDSKTLTPVDETKKIMYATLSPEGDKVAYVSENDLYIKDLSSNEVIRVTNDGETNAIINGDADWVYEEEFSMSKAFKWSPDGTMLAFQRFDERRVKEYNMQLWGSLYPIDYKFKYPKAGEDNAIVSIHVYNLESNKTVEVNTGEETNIYLPRLYWVPDSKTLSFIKLNRLQNQLDIFHADPASGESKHILRETSDTFVDLNFNDNLTYLSDGQSFIRTSEQDGFKHIYHYSTDGELIKQITEGEWEVQSLKGIDEANDKLYFTSNEVSPLEQHFYSISMDGTKKKQIVNKEGINDINLSDDYKYFINTNSSSDHPKDISLHDTKGKNIRVLENNAELDKRIKKYEFVDKEFFRIPANDGTILNGYMMKPKSFNNSKQYPVIMYVYGGPGKQTVMEDWGGYHLWWHQYMAKQGYIVVSVDNRGTDGRGVEFKHSTYKQMGKLEVEDQIKVAKYLAQQPYVDSDRIGIWGWSYGGYLSSLSLFIGNDVFKSAIAVAPVTNWRFYDTIYTERYQGLPQNNPGGYDDYSPLSHVDKLKGNYLIIHGTGDDNVHFQNSIELANALIWEGKQFQSFYYPNRDHGISGGNTRLHLYRMMTDFLKKNL